jgi:hypothetical protein
MSRVQKQSIARALGISAGLVSRYSKAGMPVTDIESARRWKEQNVRPRMTVSSAEPAPIGSAGSPPSPGRLLAVIRQLGETTDLFELAQLRIAIELLPADMRPRVELTVETWDALLGASVLAALATAHDPAAPPLTDGEAAEAGALLVAVAIQPPKEPTP